MQLARTLRVVLATLGILAALSIAGGAFFIYSGLYPVGATQQHTAPVYWLLEVAFRQSIVRSAKGIEAPPLTDRALIDDGLRLFHAHCAGCHGGPGVAPEPYSMGMMPVPANLALSARIRGPAELYWVIRHGVKMSGMPAWEFRLADNELWAIVAFMKVLPTLSPDEYRDRVRLAATPAAASGAATAAAGAPASPPAAPAEPLDPARGRIALQQYACVACHVIPGVVGANNPVGPSLAGIGSRKYLAGALPNTPGNMSRFLRAPEQFAPHTAMPDLGVSERDARDIAAFLELLK